MSDLVKRLREHIAVVFDDRGHVFENELLCDQAADRIEELENELHIMKTAGIVEVSVRNPSVMEYMKHWEGRAEAAEAELAEARCEIDFCNAQLEAWKRMAPPATKGLVRKRLEELKKDT